MTDKLMTLEELRRRLRERITRLEAILEATDPSNSQLYRNRKTELSMARRRLELLEQKVHRGPGAEL